ncbi:MAG: hypothetical protein K8F91_10755, partial [Candidatus Obscuribacterales bacterium]|nr:hypothetical protein [Candidatus Obscuribacterales bacterium]
FMISPIFSANATERFLMDGKLVPKSTYEAVILLKQGLRQLHDNNNNGAVESLTHAADLAPKMADIHHNLGIALAKVGRGKEAIASLEKARDLNANLDSTWMSLGGLYQTEGRLDDAIATYSEFLRRFPRDVNAGKIQSIVKGLEKESKLAGESSDNSDAADYMKEITRAGLVRWESSKMPLRVFIKDGEGIEGYRDSFRGLLKSAFADWQSASGELVKFVMVDSAENCHIECSWTSDPKSLKTIAEAGNTELFSSRKGLVKGTILFLTVPIVQSLPLTDNRMRRLCLHEIGHVLGMAGHTTNPQDAMFYSVGMSDIWKDLSQRDTNTIVRLYSSSEAPISYVQGE